MLSSVFLSFDREAIARVDGDLQEVSQRVHHKSTGGLHTKVRITNNITVNREYFVSKIFHAIINFLVLNNFG